METVGQIQGNDAIPVLEIRCDETVALDDKRPLATLAFDMTEGELEVAMDGMIQMRFAERRPIREIAERLGFSKSSVHRILAQHVHKSWKKIAADLRRYKGLLNPLVELLEQSNARTRRLWDEYHALGDDIKALRDTLRIVQGLTANDPPGVHTADICRSIADLHHSERLCLSDLRDETRTLLDVWHRFGLTRSEVLQEALAERSDVDKKIQEMIEFVNQLVNVIRAEVSDPKQQQRIFNRIANGVKEAHFFKEAVDDDLDAG